MKRRMKKEYIRRVKKTLSSKLNAGNSTKAVKNLYFGTVEGL